MVAESVRLDDHIQSNSSIFLFFSIFKFSIISPVNELCDSKTLTIFFASTNLFNFDRLVSGDVPTAKIFSLIFVEEIFFVYLGSITLPDHLFKV